MPNIVIELQIDYDRDMPLQFYFDFVSPYSYLCWPRMLELVEKHQQSLQIFPVLFAALLDHHGQLGPAEIPSKRSYLFRHACRVAGEHGLEFRSPIAHPFNPLLALRVVGSEMEECTRRRLIARLFKAIWVDQENIQDPNFVTKCIEYCGLEPVSVLEDAQSEAGKLRVRENTETAIKNGVFGVPTMIVEGELFWGGDAIPHLDRFLEGNDVVDHEQFKRWQAIPAAAIRKRKLMSG